MKTWRMVWVRLMLLVVWNVVAWGDSCAIGLSFCEVYANAEIIFSGPVVAQTVAEQSSVHVRREYLVQVQEPLRGLAAKDEMVVVASFDRTPLEPGKRYLFTVRTNPKMPASRPGWIQQFGVKAPLRNLESAVCGGFRELAYASKDLVWLREMAGHSGDGLIFGHVYQRPEGTTGRFQPSQTVGRIMARGPKGVTEGAIGPKGKYSLEKLEAGIYEVWAETPTGQQTERRQVVVDGSFCRKRDLFLKPQGEITGQIWQRSGVPLRWSQVELVALRPENESRFTEYETFTTDEYGRFQFRSLPEGEYLVGQGILNAALAKSLWESRTLDGKPQVPSAVKVTLREGEVIHDLSWTLPEPLPSRALKLKFSWPGELRGWKATVIVTELGNTPGVGIFYASSRVATTQLHLRRNPAYRVEVNARPEEVDGGQVAIVRFDVVAGEGDEEVFVSLDEGTVRFVKR